MDVDEQDFPTKHAPRGCALSPQVRLVFERRYNALRALARAAADQDSAGLTLTMARLDELEELVGRLGYEFIWTSAVGLYWLRRQG